MRSLRRKFLPSTRLLILPTLAIAALGLSPAANAWNPASVGECCNGLAEVCCEAAVASFEEPPLPECQKTAKTCDSSVTVTVSACDKAAKTCDAAVATTVSACDKAAKTCDAAVATTVSACDKAAKTCDAALTTATSACETKSSCATPCATATATACETKSSCATATLTTAPNAYVPPVRRDQTQFMRMTYDDETGEPTGLETAVVRYVPIDGSDFSVDLVSVIHYGDRMYYTTLNSHFYQYDSLLYELVGPPGVIPTGKKSPGSFLFGAALLFCLNLESQLKLVDYTKANFVHADLSPQGMLAAMRARGENQVTLALGVVTDMIRQSNLRKWQMEDMMRERQMQQGISQADESALEALGYVGNDAPASVETSIKNPHGQILNAGGPAYAASAPQPKRKGLDAQKIKSFLRFMVQPDTPCKLRRMAAQPFAMMGSSSAGMAGMGATIDRILIDDRNTACMNVFDEQIQSGKRRIGIFYGAAHMPDFEQRLLTQYGLKRESVEWMTAWDLRMQPRNPWEVVFKLIAELRQPQR